MCTPRGQPEVQELRKRSVESWPAPEAVQRNENAPEGLGVAQLFRKLWCHATDDNYFTLYGFRRFRTAHLLNLRFLEDEIDKTDHKIFQAGMKLGYLPGIKDNLGLRHGKKDLDAQGADDVINQELVLKLRDLLKQYGA